ncbi:hypothetical protein B0H11DRAFT_1910153 [Mycena galericulata]|nr:hypothetical protein B0H11DRAFT_1910153 [Mycena galericulata]
MNDEWVLNGSRIRYATRDSRRAMPNTFTHHEFFCGGHTEENLRARGTSDFRARGAKIARGYGGPDALLFPPRKLLTPPRKFAFFGVPARDFGSSITSTCFARTACSAPRDLAPRARKTELRHARAQIFFDGPP